MNEIIGQILGILATAVTFLSYQTNKKTSLLLVQSAATLLTCLGYLFLGAYSGFALNIVCLVRNGAIYALDGRRVQNRIAAALLSLLMVGVGMLSWQGWFSLLIIVALTLNTLFMAFGTPQVLRYSVLFTSSLVLMYNLYVFTVGGMLNEGLTIVSALIGILRYRNTKKKASKA